MPLDSIKRSTGNTMHAKVVSDEPRTFARDSSPENKSSKAMLKAMDTLTFDAWKFAVPIALAPVVIRRRVIDLIVTLLDMWVTAYDNESWDSDEELSFLIDVKRIHDALIPYRKED